MKNTTTIDKEIEEYLKLKQDQKDRIIGKNNCNKYDNKGFNTAMLFCSIKNKPVGGKPIESENFCWKTDENGKLTVTISEALWDGIVSERTYYKEQEGIDRLFSEEMARRHVKNVNKIL